MTDIVSKQKRADIMSRVRSKDSAIEKRLRGALHKAGLRFRKHVNLEGKPDIIFPKRKVAVFVDSCFWHGCARHCRMPSSNRAYWSVKIKGNKARDKKVNMHYKKEGWAVIRAWEHEINKNFGKTKNKIITLVHGSNL